MANPQGAVWTVSVVTVFNTPQSHPSYSVLYPKQWSVSHFGDPRQLWTALTNVVAFSLTQASSPLGQSHVDISKIPDSRTPHGQSSVRLHIMPILWHRG